MSFFYSMVKRHTEDPKDDTTALDDYLRNLCRRCLSPRIGDGGRGDFLCFDCGLVQGHIFESAPDWNHFRSKTYKRVFYFNERCSRWFCEEPVIADDAWEVIYASAKIFLDKHPAHIRIDRSAVCKILKSVELTPEFMKANRSRKFKKTLMSKKRFYDKYSEKWKTIVWRLTGKTPAVPPVQLVRLVKDLFGGCQKPFEQSKHATNCDRRHNCDKYFDCWHNFINYDFIFRKLLQVAEIKFKWIGVYNQFKHEFPLVSKKVREKKLRPMFQTICEYNGWPCPVDE